MIVTSPRFEVKCGVYNSHQDILIVIMRVQLLVRLGSRVLRTATKERREVQTPQQAYDALMASAWSRYAYLQKTAKTELPPLPPVERWVLQICCPQLPDVEQEISNLILSAGPPNYLPIGRV